MKSHLYVFVIFAAVLLPSSFVRSEEVTLFPNQDASLYEEAITNENGIGLNLFAGLNGGGDARRSLLSFDIAASLPSDALVTGVTLTLTADQVGAPTVDTFGLHPVTRAWQEGRVRPSREGRGEAGDGSGASWSSTGLESWSFGGGDFLETASASVLIGDVGTYTWETNDQLVADVQGWLDDPSSNFGWALVGSEVDNQSAKRFFSSENELESIRPTLQLEFEILAETLQGDFDGDGELLAADVNLLCEAVQSGQNASAFDLNADGAVDLEDQRVWVEDVRGTFFGDSNLDGSVSFEDFLTLSSNFGQTPLEAGWEAGDYDCSGAADFPDFLQLTANFGREAEASAAASVPEPSCHLLLLIATGLLGRCRRRRTATLS